MMNTATGTKLQDVLVLTCALSVTERARLVHLLNREQNAPLPERVSLDVHTRLVPGRTHLLATR